MKKNLCWLIFFTVMISGAPVYSQGGQSVSIRALKNDPGGWVHKEVVVEGHVRNVVSLPTQPSFVWYEVKDPENNLIWIKRERANATDTPVQNQRILVEGQVVPVPPNSPAVPTTESILIIERPAPPPPPPSTGEERAAGKSGNLLTWMQGNPVVAILLVVFLLLFIALILVLLIPALNRRPRSQSAFASTPVPSTPVPSTPVPQPHQPAAQGSANFSHAEQPTPVYQGPEMAGGDALTPVYYGHLAVEECADQNLVGRTFDIAFPSGRNEATLGRGAQADIRIDHRFLSRKHLRIQIRDGQLQILKVAGAKEANLNGNPVDDTYGVAVSGGDVIGLPGITLRINLQ